MTKRIILSLAMIALTIAGVTSATVAYFRDTATNANNVFAAGTLNIDIANPTSGAVFNVTGMKPGDTENGTIIVKNSGSLDMKFRGRVSIAADTAPNGGWLADVLVATVNVTGIYNQVGTLVLTPGAPYPYPIASGTIRSLVTSGFGAWDKSTMTFAFGPDWRYELSVAVHFPEAAGDQYQEATLNGTIAIDATQWDNPDWL